MDNEAAANEANRRGWAKLKTLDGASRLYTFSVLTTLALWITTVYFDAEYLHRDTDDDESDVLLQKATPLHTFSAAGDQIVRAMYLLLLCFLIGACAFFLVAINVYPFERNQVLWQSWSLIAATVSVVVTNVLVVFAMYSANERYDIERKNPNNYESPFSHLLLLCSLVISAVIMDLSFLATFTENKHELEEKEKKRSNWSVIRNRLSSLRRPPEVADFQRMPVNQQPSLRAQVRERGFKALKWLGLKALDLIAAIVEKLMQLVGMRKAAEAGPTNIGILCSFSIDVSDAFVDVPDVLMDLTMTRWLHTVLTFFTWNMWAPFRRWFSKAQQPPESERMCRVIVHRFATCVNAVIQWFWNFPRRNREWIDCWYDAIREDRQFEHSAWVLAAMCVSFVLLFYFGVQISSQVSGYLDEMYTPRRDCAVYSIDNNGQLGNFIFRLAGFTENSRNTGDAAFRADDEVLTRAACQIPDLGSDASVPTLPPVGITEADAQSILEEALPTNLTIPNTNATSDGRLYRCSTNDFSPDLCLPLLLINEYESNISRTLNESMEPVEVFKDHGIGRTIYVVDRMLRHIRWTVWIGLIVGLIVGMFSLLSVLAQYKRFSLAIRSGFFKDLHMSKNLAILDNKDRYVQQFEDVVTEREWAKLIEKYPMGSSAFFFGILVSTAVIQLVVFGFTVAMLLALIVSIFDDRVFVILRPYMALLIAFLITWLVNGPIAQRVVCERFLVRKYQVLWELPFLAFLLVYTAVHLVLGVFFAVMRLVWVLLTSIACLNRLDRNLFPILQGLDLGHKSFMAMVLMHHAFLSNAEEDEKLPFHVLVDRMRQQQLRPMRPSSSDTDQKPATPTSPDMASVVHEAMSKKETLSNSQLTIEVEMEESEGTAALTPPLPRDPSRQRSGIPRDPSRLSRDVSREQSGIPSTPTAAPRDPSTTTLSREESRDASAIPRDPSRELPREASRDGSAIRTDLSRSGSSLPSYLRDDFHQQ